jgi:hypothetical protein
MRLLLIIATLVGLSPNVFGQGFPWEIFKPRTLKEVISITTKAARSDDSMFLATNELESKVQVTKGAWSLTSSAQPIIERTVLQTVHTDDLGNIAHQIELGS